MADANTESTKSYVGTLDVVLLASFVGALVYWFCRKKKSDVAFPSNRLTTVQPTARVVQDDTSFIGKMNKSGKTIAIFYGSQTGTAEEFAGRLAKDAQRYGLKAAVFDPEEVDIEELTRFGEITDGLAIFVMATYGEGDPTDNAQELYEWLQNDRDDLDCLNFAVFGLGNKTYEHYNSMGRFVDKKLEEMGAKRVFERGEGDDDGNIEEDFVRWREDFWPEVLKFYNINVRDIKRRLSSCIDRQFKVVLQPDISVDKVFTGEVSRLKSYQRQRPPFDAKNPYLAPIRINRELHKGGDRSCMHIELDISGSSIKYDAGDHVGIYPTNDHELVDKIGQLLDTDLDTVVSLDNVDEDASKKHPFPCPTSYRTALLHYVDITSTVKTHVLRELAEYAKDEKEKSFLMNISDSTEEAKHQYNDWIVKSHRHIVAVLEDLPSLRPPLGHILELLPRLHCRYYSISSSSKLHAQSIHVTAVVVHWKTNTGREQKGVATTWLKTKIPQGDDCPRVPIFVRKTTFRLPFKPVTPVIMVGPGTGLAPFRGFIQERSYQVQQGKRVGETVLYFGCRKKGEDYIYEDELGDFVKEGALTQLHVAFSRDQAQKVYVQNKMEESKDDIWKILDQGGHIYVCGDARNMARDVHKMIESIAQEIGGMTESQAVDFVKKLSAKGRYSTDVWS
ncbi:NADPH--cytochrome P450 reductase [Exaiptasia diaphana]|uniref:NADPH--cytochrome P450 reductase n=1 Tax=Exaiptasia diaphana TaxID=2652724 RepID=A0A913Y6B4_EXADI|nr:NADPH--cytochrome P450 reductase [Exaiptasia diaphana]KXJ28988.1 NADPH--cytochrome P450 reductase [Exaiptasia diaphana]